MDFNNRIPGQAPYRRGRGRGRGAGAAAGRGNWRARNNAQERHGGIGDQAGNHNQRQHAGGIRNPQREQGGQEYNRQGRPQDFQEQRQNQERRNNNRNRYIRENDQQRNRQDGTSDDRNDRQNRNDRCMGFITLNELAQGENQDVIEKINDRKTSFLNLLESTIDKGDFYVLIMEVIKKVCQSTFDELKSKLLLDICNSRFIRNLSSYVMDLPYVEIRSKSRNNLYWNNQSGFWNNFVVFCQSIVELSPSIALEKCRPLIEDTSRVCLEKLKERHDFILSDEYNLKLQKLRERLTFHEKEEMIKQEEKKNILRNPFIDDSDPPDDFRQLSVIPGVDDLLDQRPFLRPNIVNGGYQSTDHYLDVQFRLLREDCFGPLREGITQFIQDPNKKKYDNIRVYNNVKFVEPFISKNKIGETIQLDEKAMRRFKRINWTHNKRFIFGSLLLFTKDACKSFITSTILERDVNLLSRGKIPVSIVDGNINNDDSSYTMIESEVYFEPYFHVLKALQDPKFPEHLAMNQYIVRVDPASKPAAYLTPEAVFSVQTEYSAKTKFRVLDESTWPTRHELGFNETQYEAYKLALTHEFAVIQGPPGTGKTFLGVKVAKTLLENLSLGDIGSCLLLVICYTNHALDQFLENILPVTQSIVRIGGQSRNEAMEKINLTTLRKNTQVNYTTKKLFFEQRRNLSTAVQALKHAQGRLDAIYNGVISFDKLKDQKEVEILGKYYAQYRKDVKTDPLRHWLFEHKIDVDFNNLIQGEENTEEQNNLHIIKEQVDQDEERIELILDEFEDEQENINDMNLPENQQIRTSFSLNDTENKLKTMIALYIRTTDRQKQQLLQREITDMKSRANLFIEMLSNRTRRTRFRIDSRMDLSAVSMADRWALYFRWADVVTAKFKRHMKPLQETLDSANTAYEEARMMMDLKIMNGIKVVGMTTSGAARLRKLVQALAPPIVIVEEAAEVLEQHIVTSLTKHCQHLILIGDHQQLRPSAAHMRLARYFNLEISLFERMISNGMHSRRLGVQHRMRPEIAALISPHIYPDLQNHASVERFPRVRGVTDNLFFLTHNYKEEEVDDSSSKSNQPEADMTLKLANYLMQQGYEPSDVTILAAYSGQMFYMRKQREKYLFLQKVKITVVDNYQGEESKIILLSLVRNNSQNKIGFLGTENRVCVALSRAREGFYILGNINILKNNSELWTKIAGTLEKEGSVGAAMILKCESHPEQITSISSPKDFEKVPEGGCLLKCNYELPCGHGCTLICHAYDRGHVNTKCYLPCERVLCSLGHVCPLVCSTKCQPCKRLVKKELPCGHSKPVYCYKDSADPTIKCETVVKVKLPNCGHEVNKPCHLKIDNVKCPVRCIYRVEQCGHECLLTCHVDNDPDHEKYLCQKPCAKSKKGCTADLVGDRGNHQCMRKCYEPCERCTVEVIKKRSTCNHAEKVACNRDLEGTLCLKKCSRLIPACGHHCKKKCHEVCGDCTAKVEKTIPDCNHKIKVLCKIPPTRDLCREKCQRILACGHACTQTCDQICDPRNCTKQRNDMFLSPCGHRVTLPCNVYVAMGEVVIPETLLKYCKQPCGTQLACEHTCAGTCGSCHQGRIHIACQGRCDRPQICGHLCNEFCNKVCPPCSKICDLKCPHSQCNKVCGAPCIPCQEPCTRKCRHGACKRRCGEPCSRPPCDEPCARRLPCGHRCRGLCGEPCPDICNICRPEDFPTNPICFGDPYEDDDKIVRLEDCRHFLDVENMDNLMIMGDSGDGEISIRKCPICKTPIVNTPRYKDFVNHTFKTGINPIKERVYGNENVIKKRREELFLKVIEFSEKHNIILSGNPDISLALNELHKIVKTQKKASLPKLETQFQCLEILDMIGECAKKYSIVKTKTLQSDFSKLIKLICTTLLANIHKISEQLQKDIGNELKRMNSLIQLEKIFSHTSYLSLKEAPKVKQAAEEAMQFITSWRQFEQEKAVIILKQLEEAVKVSGIVTKEERDLIIKAIGSKPGSWYKCPNGHPYSIGQCGGAMEVSKCTDCGAAIGGQNHTLLGSNAHAGELDGSPFAAWSDEYNNMANWRF